MKKPMDKRDTYFIELVGGRLDGTRIESTALYKWLWFPTESGGALVYDRTDEITEDPWIKYEYTGDGRKDHPCCAQRPIK